MAHLLGAEALHLEVPTRVVFDSVTLGVDSGDRIGIVGRNGDGKSSLIQLLSGLRDPDSGRVTRRGGVRVGVLDQADTLADTLTVADTVVGDRAEHDWAGDARIRDIIVGLLHEVPWHAQVATLSGGQRRRVALARILSADLDVLMLDEPTNHLDVEAIAWLAAHLKRRWSAGSGALLVVTHDRWFLDEVCTATWEVHDRLVEPFEGGYAAYVLQRVERDKRAAATEARRQNLARRELAWLRRGAPARTSKPKFRIDAANALIADVPELRNPAALQSLAITRLGKDVVDLLDAGVEFEGHPVITGVEWRLAPGERVGILGPNGAGKSTLLALVSGRLAPTSGRVKRGKTVRVAQLSQRVDELEPYLGDPVLTMLGELRTTYTFGTGSRAQELTPAQLLERLGFDRAQLSTRVGELSGGQQRRLQLLLILLSQPNVLLLDEPTNDFDIEMLSALEELLDAWPGTLLVVSHDRYFLERVTDNQFALLDGRLRHLPGGVDEYLRLRAAETSSGGETGSGSGARGDDSGSRAGEASATSSPAGGRVADADAGQERTVTSPLLTGADRRAAEKEFASIERRLAKLQQQIGDARAALVDHDQSDYLGLGAEMERIVELELEQAQLERRWYELGEQLE